jgi:hypothetical protein
MYSMHVDWYEYVFCHSSKHSKLFTFTLKVVTNEKEEAVGEVLTITYMLVGEVVLDVFLSF